MRLLQLVVGWCIMMASSSSAFAPVQVVKPSIMRVGRPLSMSAAPPTVEPKIKESKDVKEDIKEEEKSKVGGEAWEVRLWNDPFNKREFVARCLNEVCGKSDGESFQIMMQAHKNGMGMIGRYAFEIAELYTSSLTEKGLMIDMIQVDDE